MSAVPFVKVTPSVDLILQGPQHPKHNSINIKGTTVTVPGPCRTPELLLSLHLHMRSEKSQSLSATQLTSGLPNGPEAVSRSCTLSHAKLWSQPEIFSAVRGGLGGWDSSSKGPGNLSHPSKMGTPGGGWRGGFHSALPLVPSHCHLLPFRLVVKTQPAIHILRYPLSNLLPSAAPLHSHSLLGVPGAQVGRK